MVFMDATHFEQVLQKVESPSNQLNVSILFAFFSSFFLLSAFKINTNRVQLYINRYMSEKLTGARDANGLPRETAPL